MTLTIQIRSVYGEPKAYPMDHAAQCIAAIANTKTLTRNSLAQALSMGLTIIELDRYGRECARYEGGRSNLPAIN